MLSALLHRLRDRRVQRRAMVLVGAIVVLRLGANVPAPGVNLANVLRCVDPAGTATHSALQLLQLLSGGALLRVSIFALGIVPFLQAWAIRAAILTGLSWGRRISENGDQKALVRLTRNLLAVTTFGFAGFLVYLVHSGQLYQGLHCDLDTYPLLAATGLPRFVSLLLIGSVAYAGATVVVYIAETLNAHDLPGVAIVLFVSAVSQLPRQATDLVADNGWWRFGAALGLAVPVWLFIVLMSRAERRIEVQDPRYHWQPDPSQLVTSFPSQRAMSTRSYVPLRADGAATVAIGTAAAVVGGTQSTAAASQEFMSPNITIPMFGLTDDPFSWWYIAALFAVVVAISRHATMHAVVDDLPSDLRRYGRFGRLAHRMGTHAYIPGVRPQRETAEYLRTIAARLWLPGAAYVGVVTVLPHVASRYLFDLRSFPVGGLAALVLVGTSLEIVALLHALTPERYVGYLDDATGQELH